MTSNRNLPLILFTLLLSSFLLAYYFYLIKPVKDEADSKQNEIVNAKQEVATLQARLEAVEWDDDAESDMELLKKLPDNRELPEVIQLLQEAELITQSTIQTMTFNDYDGELPESLLPPEPVVEEEANTESVEDSIETTETDAASTDAENPFPVSEIAQIPLPEDLKLLTLEITVQHSDYEQFLLFLDEIERNDRLIKIDTVNFVLPGELADTTDVETISSTIQMTTFYLK